MIEEGGESVGTGFGDVPLDAMDATPDTGDTTQPAPDGDAAPTEPEPQAPDTEGGAEPTVPEKFAIDGTDYSLEDLRGLVEAGTDPRAALRTANEDWRNAKEAREEAKTLAESAEYKDFQFFKRQVQQNPGLADEWAQARQWGADGTQHPTGAMLQQARRIEALETRVGTSEQAETLAAAKEIMDGFLTERNGIYEQLGMDAGKWDENSPEFAEFFEQFKADVGEGSVLNTDLSAYWWNVEGKNLFKQAQAQARRSGQNEAVTKLKAGKAASKSEVAATGAAKSTPFIDPSRDDLESEIQSAVADGEVWAGW